MRFVRLGVLVFVASALFAQSAGVLHKALAAEAKRLRTWSDDAIFVDAAGAQNARRVALAEIMKIDEEWQAGKTIETVTSGPCADRLRHLMRDRDYYVEAFLTDNRGALVCASAVTTDYFQGDEAKWSRAFDEGRGNVFIDRPRFDDSAKATVGVISLPVRDGATVVGVLSVGVSADKLPASE